MPKLLDHKKEERKDYEIFLDVNPYEVNETLHGKQKHVFNELVPPRNEKNRKGTEISSITSKPLIESGRNRDKSQRIQSMATMTTIISTSHSKKNSKINRASSREQPPVPFVIVPTLLEDNSISEVLQLVVDPDGIVDVQTMRIESRILATERRQKKIAINSDSPVINRFQPKFFTDNKKMNSSSNRSCESSTRSTSNTTNTTRKSTKSVASKVLSRISCYKKSKNMDTAPISFKKGDHTVTNSDNDSVKQECYVWNPLETMKKKKKEKRIAQEERIEKEECECDELEKYETIRSIQTDIDLFSNNNHMISNPNDSRDDDSHLLLPFSVDAILDQLDDYVDNKKKNKNNNRSGTSDLSSYPFFTSFHMVNSMDSVDLNPSNDSKRKQHAIIANMKKKCVLKSKKFIGRCQQHVS